MNPPQDHLIQRHLNLKAKLMAFKFKDYMHESNLKCSALIKMLKIDLIRLGNIQYTVCFHISVFQLK